MIMNEEDDVLETKPSILSLLNSLYEQPTQNSPNGRQTASPSPPLGRSSMTTDTRASLEDRFLELVQQHPCFYDPRDKNFAHNQFKSNVYGSISKKLNSEGFHITGTQLATMFKGIKAKYRDEARKLSRMDGEEMEPSAFFKKLGFLETGINSVDQRLSNLRTSVSNQKQSVTEKDGGKDRYVSAFATALDKFSPEMKGGFLNFITALNELHKPVKKLETFTRAARELKNKPGANLEVVNSHTTSKINGTTDRQELASNYQSRELIPDLESIGKTFEGQKNLLALFRVLGNVVVSLPERRRHAHLQGLLNISSAALHSPVQISWQSEVYKPVDKCLRTAEHTITIDGPSLAEIEGIREEREDSVRVITPEVRKAPKRKLANDRGVNGNESDNDESEISIINDESSHGRFPRAAKERSFVTQMLPTSRSKRH